MHTVSMRCIGLTFIVSSIGIAGCVAIGVTSCVVSSRPSAITREQLVGNYEVTFPFGRSSLHVGSDGRYAQEMEVGGQRASTSGTWRHGAEDWYAYLTLEDPLHPTDGFGRMNQGWQTRFPGFFVMPITRKFVVGGPVEITFDEVYSYTKRQ